ncbi:rhamnose-binding lectin isoform X2 [Hydra vulgaris]|uniref:Rhamnose-binding lectin isoform X2 n=1 Tax=Hydra vulgaris TaxID=6087 RepID=A0ABM4CYX6_HYDVU
MVKVCAFFAFVFFVGVAHAQVLRTSRACEGYGLKIDCTGHGVIEVVSANYGRTLSNVCPGAQSSNVKCNNQAKSLEVARKSCSGRSSCLIQATNAVFGDPCVGTYKYLEVQYRCKVPVHVARACEGFDLKIVCNSHEVIEVLNANYGRTLSNVCPGAQSSNVKCNNQPKSLVVVRNSCSGRSSCVIKASNAVFGDPCVGTYKYLEVQYQCKSPVHVARACEGSGLKISCKGHGVINVLNANYGRTLSNICPGAQSSNTKCNNQAKSLAVARNSCSGRSSCAIQATNAVFGDPCVGTYKYLEVQYQCIPQVNVVRACEGSNLKIDCNGNGNIKVLHANYGRKLSNICPGAQSTNINCNNLGKSLAVTQLQCFGKPSCTVAATNAVFSDPCVGTYKYLEVMYSCF